ncbi:DNA-directed RNA polymerase subunit omega [Pararhodospirillum oryzae]|uniref:DNA-directed RNA polymerase subunit omega n=1 Tax=Pararhodospirillum oryzae TaxID=478448 RepID=A0A512H6P1_9PROT|nr:DNA-directed RNA polymerase subunit omega [Pararhodospirillum oryzae]GEO81136.1 DNA-directed RNA polymerase subunit omega [Pararhodospirillum oryzae]
MARVTVEDCILKIPNRFELVLIAAQRGRQISAGAPLTLDRDNDKNPVVALREVASENVDLSLLKENLIQSLQKHVEIDEPEDDEFDALSMEREFARDNGSADLSEELLADGLSIQEASDDDLEAGLDALGLEDGPEGDED